MHFELNKDGLLDRMLTVDEVAQLLQVHPSTVRRWEKQGQLKSYRLGAKGIIRFKRGEVSDFINLAANGREEGYWSLAKSSDRGGTVK